MVTVAAVVASGCTSASHPSASGAGTTATTPPHSAPTTPTERGTGAVPPVTRLQAVTEPWSLPAAVSRPVVLPDGNGFVILGGLATGDVSTSRIVRVDPAAGQAAPAGQLALAVHDSAGAQLHGEWFVFGGGSYSTVAEVQGWTSGVATDLGRLPDSRSDLSTVTAGSTAYLIGGFDGTSLTPDVLATQDGVTFRVVGQLAVPVRYGAVAAAGGAIWIIGGVTGTSEGATAETDAIQRLDPATGKVAVVGRLSQPMAHATAVTLDNQVFVLGGRSGSVPSATIWRLDPATSVLSAAGALPQALSDAGSVVVGGSAYLVGGEITGPAAPLSSVVVLHPATP